MSDKLLPNIYDYLNTFNNQKLLSNELDYISEKIFKETQIPKEISQEIIKLLFQEIKSSILNGYIINIRKFGKIYISSPKNSKNKKRVFVKFEPSKILIKKLNNNE